MSDSVMKDFYKRFCRETLDEEGRLKDFELTLKEDFNFGYDVIDELARLVPEKKMLHWINDHGGDKEFTYAEISSLSNMCANMLLEHGVKKGDKIIAVLKRHYEFWILAYAAIKIGAILIPATCQLMPKDYIYRFKAAGITYAFITEEDDATAHVDEACKEYDGLKEKFVIHGRRRGWTEFRTEIRKYSDKLERQDVKRDDYMLAYFSSGTTGFPKMAIHTNAYPAGSITTAKYWHHLDETSVHLTVSETGWAKCAWGKMFGQLIVGAEEFVYDMDRFNADKLMGVLQNYYVTSFCAPPTMYRFFIKTGLGNYDLSGLKYSCVAGEALNPEVYNRWKEYTGLDLMEGFGQTETVVIVANFFGMKPKPGSMGKPSPLYDVDIIDEAGNSCGPNETGEIVIRAERGKHPALFREYYNTPDITDRAWRGGVYHTGDTAYKDEDGYFWYVGRTDDVIKASGYRIGPFEIESILMEHPAVMECAVTAADDEVRGKVVKATIVLTPDHIPVDRYDSEKLKKELQTFVKKSTAPYKYPRIVEFVKELPKTVSGKIRRVEIRENDSKKKTQE